MKKNYLNTGLLLLLTLVFGCQDFLTEENPGNVTIENYTTQEGYEGLINATYASLREVYAPTPYMFTAGTDLFFGAHQEVPLGLATYQTLTPSSSPVKEFFETLYQTIQIANIALEYADLTEEFDQLPVRVAEAQTIRAFYYFLLVQHFGDVSLVTDMVKTPVTHFDRRPANEVYQFIIDELESAIEALPNEQGDFGRVTKRAAQHLLAKVYLTRGYEEYGSESDFSTAASLADEAIGGQGLNLTFNELFAFGNDKNEEILWSVQYAEGSTQTGLQHNWDYPWGPLAQDSDDGVNKKNVLHPTEYLLTLFSDADSRFEGTFLNIRTTPYAGWILDPENSPVVYYYPRTQDQLADTANWRAENPETRSETVIVPVGPSWWDGLNQESFPSLRKFDRLRNSEMQYTHDIYLARLGETYLIAAEAYFQANDPEEAAERINEVRQRAAMPGQEAAMTIDAADVDINLILDERARELAGEGHRWLDLKRTGKLIEYTQMHNPEIRGIFDSGTNPFVGKNGNLKILRPIPLSAIALDDGNYPQNPAYD